MNKIFIVCVNTYPLIRVPMYYKFQTVKLAEIFDWELETQSAQPTI
jgi:hypothetical protein